MQESRGTQLGQGTGDSPDPATQQQLLPADGLVQPVELQGLPRAAGSGARVRAHQLAQEAGLLKY